MAHPVFCIVAAFFLFFEFHDFVGAQNIGVNYGRLGDNLPPPDQVVNLFKSNNIKKVRIFDPNPEALKALQNSGIQVILGVINNDLPTLANDPVFAANWVQINVVSYAPTINFRCIDVGNELIPGNLASFVLPAMQALQKALIAANLLIPVSTAVSQQILSTSFPPSAGSWNTEAEPYIIPIAQFLQANKYPLLCNVYPFFSYGSDPDHIRLDYALINTTEVIVQDGSLGYTNLLDASVDAIYSALEKVGANNVEIVVSETGWPSGGTEPMANIINAQTYNNNVIARLKANVGTPKRPGKVLESYIFATFNEDLKPEGSEQHFGLFYPDMTEVYHINF